MTEERIGLSQRERDRSRVLHEVEENHLKQVAAAARLKLSVRQVRRVQVRWRAEGDGGLVHRGRGRASKRKQVAWSPDLIGTPRLVPWLFGSGKTPSFRITRKVPQTFWETKVYATNSRTNRAT